MCLLNGGEAACTSGFIDHHNATCNLERHEQLADRYVRSHGSFYWPCTLVYTQSSFPVIHKVDNVDIFVQLQIEIN